jgi:hypothetical protein
MPNHTLGGALIQTVRLPDFGGAGRVARWEASWILYQLAFPSIC